jgi:predicted nuclease of predicted toxin-antitoxin system
MNFLLDQSTDARLVAWLTEGGHNAQRIGRDYPPGLPDEEVLAIAKREGRILITDDRDFGELVFRHRQPHTGVIYLRLASYSFALTTARLEDVLTHHADRLDRFLIVTPGGVRERRR